MLDVVSLGCVCASSYSCAVLWSLPLSLCWLSSRTFLSSLSSRERAVDQRRLIIHSGETPLLISVISRVYILVLFIYLLQDEGEGCTSLHSEFTGFCSGS